MIARKSYHEQLEELQQEVLKLGTLVEQAIFDAVKSLKERDEDLARQIIEGDDLIDDYQVKIEDFCVRLLALQQPMAVDLRVISTALKISVDLERMGDHAVDIAKVTLRLAGQTLIKPLIDIPRMAEIAQKMIRESLDAYVERSTSRVESLVEHDHEVDALYNQVFRELLTYMIEDPWTIRQAAQLIFVARFLERVADHATNLGEAIYYMVTGERKSLNL